MTFRDRKGAIAVLAALMLMLLLTFVAYVVDFSKIFVMRDELHTGADAMVLAAAVNYQRTRDTAAAKAAAVAFANENRVLNVMPVVDSVVPGNWDPAVEAWTSVDAGGAPINAFQVWTRHPTNYLFSGVSQMATKQVYAASTAWADAPVTETDCVTPWSVPYDSLTRRINPTADPFRDLTQAELEEFLGRSIAQRTITLKTGTPATPGNFFIIDFPPAYRAATGTEDTPERGGREYRENLQPCELMTPAEQARTTTGTGDILLTDPGGKQGPTILGAEDLVGYKITIPFSVGSPRGRDYVTVKILGGFVVGSVNQGQKTITGYFTDVARTGRIGNGPSVIRASILVQ